MGTFLVIVGMIAWVICTVLLAVACIAAVVVVVEEVDEWWPAVPITVVVAILVFSANCAGLGLVIASNGWMDDAAPADGCYMVRHDTELMPIVAGKVITFAPYDNTNWAPIPCPGR